MKETRTIGDIEGPHVAFLNNDIRHLHTLVVNELKETEKQIETGQAEEYQLEYKKFLIKKLEDLVAMSDDGEMLVVTPLKMDE
jgi:CCR4-NOT transcriptional regulation complex NOT5 subunit